MAIGYKRLPSLALCLIAAAQLMTGCNQPATSSKEGPVGSSSSPAASAEGTVRQQASGSDGRGTAGASTDGTAGRQGLAGSTSDGTAAQSAGAAQEAVSGTSDKSADGVVSTADGKLVSAAPGGSAAASVSSAQPTTAVPKAVQQTADPEEKKPEPARILEANTAAAGKAENTQAPSPSSTSVKIAGESGKPTPLTFKDLYSDITVRGVNLSDQIKQLSGKKVEMTGFMAPPLTAKVNFFVLTKVALSICPFCSSDADWPTDIVVVYMPKGKDVAPTEHQVKVTGTLSVGSQTDNNTGFVSLIRIEADKLEVLP